MLVYFTDFCFIVMDFIYSYKRLTIVTFSISALLTCDYYITVIFEFCVYQNLRVRVFDIRNVFKQLPARSDDTFDILNG